MSNFCAIKTFPTANFLDDDHRTYPHFLQMSNFFDKSWISQNWHYQGANLRPPIDNPLLYHSPTLKNKSIKLKVLLWRMSDYTASTVQYTVWKLNYRQAF